MNQIITTLIEEQPLDTRGLSNNCKEIYRGFSSPPACGKHVGSVMPLETRQTWGILETGLAVRTSLWGHPYGDILMGTSLWGHTSGVVVTVLEEVIPLWVLCSKPVWLGLF